MSRSYCTEAVKWAFCTLWHQNTEHPLPAIILVYTEKLRHRTVETKVLSTLSTIVADYSRRKRRQFVAEFGDSFGDSRRIWRDSRRFQRQSPNSATVVASADKVLDLWQKLEKLVQEICTSRLRTRNSHVWHAFLHKCCGGRCCLDHRSQSTLGLVTTWIGEQPSRSTQSSTLCGMVKMITSFRAG